MTDILDTIKTKEQARDYAIQVQQKNSEDGFLSYQDLVEQCRIFKILGAKFHLIREFKENGLL